jgi:hypothetical protein
MRIRDPGVALGYLGLGATLVTAGLALGLVDLPPLLLWTMGAIGGVLIIVGLKVFAWPRGPTPSQLLADEIDNAVENARQMLQTIHSGYSLGLFGPDTCALDAEVSTISTEAMQWSDAIAQRLRPTTPDLALRFDVPEELDPEDVLAHHVEDMLATRINQLLGIIRGLRHAV